METIFISDRMRGLICGELLDQTSLNVFKGNPEYCIVYETTYTPGIDSGLPFLYSGSTWRNTVGYVGSLTAKEYKQWWVTETAINAHNFIVNVLCALKKSNTTKEKLKDIEHSLQLKENHHINESYFNVNCRRGGPGSSKGYLASLRLKEPEKWKMVDKLSALKAAETKKKWSPERKKALSDRLSKAFKGRKNYWNAEIRKSRPKRIYYSQYTIVIEDKVHIVATYSKLRDFMKEFNNGKEKNKRVSPEYLTKHKNCVDKGIELIKIEQINTESGIIKTKYQR